MSFTVQSSASSWYGKLKNRISALTSQIVELTNLFSASSRVVGLSNWTFQQVGPTGMGATSPLIQTMTIIPSYPVGATWFEIEVYVTTTFTANRTATGTKQRLTVVGSINAGVLVVDSPIATSAVELPAGVLNTTYAPSSVFVPFTIKGVSVPSVVLSITSSLTGSPLDFTVRNFTTRSYYRLRYWSGPIPS